MFKTAEEEATRKLRQCLHLKGIYTGTFSNPNETNLAKLLTTEIPHDWPPEELVKPMTKISELSIWYETQQEALAEKKKAGSQTVQPEGGQPSGHQAGNKQPSGSQQGDGQAQPSEYRQKDNAQPGPRDPNHPRQTIEGDQHAINTSIYAAINSLITQVSGIQQGQHRGAHQRESTVL